MIANDLPEEHHALGIDERFVALVEDGGSFIAVKVDNDAYVNEEVRAVAVTVGDSSDGYSFWMTEAELVHMIDAMVSALCDARDRGRSEP